MFVTDANVPFPPDLNSQVEPDKSRLRSAALKLCILLVPQQHVLPTATECITVYRSSSSVSWPQQWPLSYLIVAKRRKAWWSYSSELGELVSTGQHLSSISKTCKKLGLRHHLTLNGLPDIHYFNSQSGRCTGMIGETKALYSAAKTQLHLLSRTELTSTDRDNKYSCLSQEPRQRALAQLCARKAGNTKS